MTHYRYRDDVSFKEVLVLAILAVIVMGVVTMCHAADIGKAYWVGLPTEKAKPGQILMIGNDGWAHWDYPDLYDAVKWKEHNPPQWEQPTATNITMGPWELLPLPCEPCSCRPCESCPRMAVDASGSKHYIEYTNPIGYDVIETTSGLLSDDTLANLQQESDDWAERVALKYETIVVLKHSLQFLELQRGQSKILSELFDLSLGKDKKRDKEDKRIDGINRELSKRIKDLIKNLKERNHDKQ